MQNWKGNSRRHLVMIKTISIDGMTNLLITKDNEIIMDITAKNGIAGYIDTDKCRQVLQTSDKILNKTTIRIEVSDNAEI